MFALPAQLTNDQLEPIEEVSQAGWVMNELKPKHIQVCQMLAQGIPRGTIAAVIGITPEYVTMLSKQPLVVAHIKELCQYAGLQLDAMFAQTVDVIGEVMANGNNKERIQAARLQLEATKRIGAGSGLPTEVISSDDRLTRLAERLTGLLERTIPLPQTTITIEGEYHEHAQHQDDQDDLQCTGQQGHESAQGDGDGESY